MADKPDIILFMRHGVGWGDLGSVGDGDDRRTPRPNQHYPEPVLKTARIGAALFDAQDDQVRRPVQRMLHGLTHLTRREQP